MALNATSAPNSTASCRSGLRAVLVAACAVGAVVALILFAYELALARIPQHRAALERIVRAQTGLDIRFTELGLRWGWYGPEAVFRQVELDEPDSAEALLRAPELVVGFDAWRTLRSGHPEAGRIELVAPDIDLSSARERRGVAAAHGPGKAVVIVPGAAVGSAAAANTSAGASSVLGRVAVLQGWRGGRIDIEGGTLRLPDRGGNANLLNVQIRRASLRRSDDDWSVAGLVYLPDRVGHSARFTLRVTGDLGEPAGLAGTLHVEARRLLFPGCRDFLAGLPDFAPYLPRGGSGDVTADVSFAHGHVVQANGNTRASGLVFDALPGSQALLALGRLQGDWRVTRVSSGWHIHADSLDLIKGEPLATLTLDTGGSIVAGASGRWIRGSVEKAPLEPILAVVRWLAPHFDLAGIQLEGSARSLVFDWASGRPDGERLQTAARLENVALVPQSRQYTLSGLGAELSGTESHLRIGVESRSARLELAQSQQQALSDVHVSSILHVSSGSDGWQIATEGFLLEHQRASLRLSGQLQDDPIEPRIVASGTLTGADIPLVAKLLGANTAQAFGAVASRLTAGRIQNAEFALRGPIGQLPFEAGGDGFTGSLTLRGAVLAGGDLWPNAEALDAHIEWHGARIQATIEAGRAGPFQLASAKAQWGADGRGATRLLGHVNGRLEDALAWVRDHPQLQEYVPGIRDIDAHGDAAFDFNVVVPAGVDAESQQSQVLARVATFVDRASVQAISGLPPLDSVTGSFAFDSGHLQRSTLTGSWLGGPVSLRMSERREKGARVLAVQAQGTLKAQHLAALANAAGAADGDTDWSGELAYVQSEGSRWRMRADSNLLGVMSTLPEPFAKRSAAAVPVHLEVTGEGDTAQVRANLGDRIRSVLALKRTPEPGWVVDRGAIHFGTLVPVLPSEPLLLVRGRIGALDLPSFALAWQRLRRDSLPTIRAQMVAGEMLVGDRRYNEVAVRAERTEVGTDLLIDSAAVAGVAHWPTPRAAGGTRTADVGAVRGNVSEVQVAELHLTRLDLPDGTLPSEAMGLVAALAPTAQLSVDELNWRGRSLGRLTASLTADGPVIVIDNARLVNGTQDARGVLRCQTAMPICRLTFMVDSTDASATLLDLGFRPEIAASGASLKGDLEWRPTPDDRSLATLHGTFSMRLADGTLRDGQRVIESSESADRTPFALLAVPALVSALNAHGPSVSPLTKPKLVTSDDSDAVGQHDLHFARLEADFEVQDGQANTANLHFDGDAEILMRGRTGLVTRDYDQQVWVLRGEERLPAAVRRFGATPRVAAAWLSLRDLFAGGGLQDRSRAVLRLQGSWDDPMVVAD